ncbi:Beta-galactosidase C-terminal domain [Halocatena marina]|uniref:Beta-galactosidase C-terminal domain n=2 Tax=Halocatena marina TaxID=2934937 RepID=A0ABD5YYL2_9EURY
MNTSGAPERGSGHGTTYELELPDDVSMATDLMTGERVSDESVTVSPRSTRILKLEIEEESKEESN